MSKDAFSTLRQEAGLPREKISEIRNQPNRTLKELLQIIITRNKENREAEKIIEPIDCLDK